MSRLKTDAIRNVNASVDGITLDTSGNVVIPEGLLHIGGTDHNANSGADDLIIGTTSGTDNHGITIKSPTNKYGRLYFADGNSSPAWHVGQIEYNHSDNSLVVYTASSESFRITSDGKVGIGVTNPNATLTVSHAANTADGIQVQNTNNSQGSAVAQVLIMGGDNAYGSLKLECNGTNHSIQQDGNGHLKFVNASTERFRITSDGKVAIGFNAPAVAGLSIANGSTSLGFEFDTGSGFSGGPTIRGYYRPGSAYKSLGITGSDIKFGINDVEKIRIDANGYLGLGINDPHLYYAKELVVKAASEGGITIRNTGANDWNYIMFATGTSGSSRYSGWIAYDHGDNKLKIAVNEDVSGKGFEFLANGNLEIKDGNLIVASGHGIDFSATSNGTGSSQAELFSDYETGVWTPTVETGTWNSVAGLYTKIGNKVFIRGWCYGPSDTSSSNDVKVTGLPFTGTNNEPAGTNISQSSGNFDKLYFHDGSGSPYLRFIENNGGGSLHHMAHSDLGSTGGGSPAQLQFVGFYNTNA